MDGLLIHIAAELGRRQHRRLPDPFAVQGEDPAALAVLIRELMAADSTAALSDLVARDDAWREEEADYGHVMVGHPPRPAGSTPPLQSEVGPNVVASLRYLRSEIERLEIEVARESRAYGTTVRQLAGATDLSERQATKRYRSKPKD